ncbi:phosphate-starvation-inducible PsiE family protein [Gloeobacter kilaueensis]|uniref:Phosphate-starvation-inducible E n=1 Tax=Gloeobacter kilaueensis (strain ATCC BAA-2537 / CCAP 1431/1 / ULC 316 / JS1) TaxID=1183438 RepID=U5QMW7_GLOK1|nr:phosphate-starvation-inducible PsiE family protein [Gloeobacter kilaueensis]AGY60248.1 hypothetical protein GKIL_4002 [Gloeobacter kilaueensis JS1]
MRKEPTADQIDVTVRSLIIDRLENVQDLIVMSLCLSLFGVMVLKLWALLQLMLQPLDFQEVSAEILFVLILVELFRLLIIYLREHRISVSVAVEVTIVSVLREVIVHEVLKTPAGQILSICLFLLVLGGLLLVRAWIAKLMHAIALADRESGLELSTAHPEDYGSLSVLKKSR